MPSLGQKMFGYFRQLSFIAEPREEIKPVNQCFITKYLSSSGSEPAQINGPSTKIYSGKTQTDLPELKIKEYDVGADTIRCALTGPNEGLCSVRRSRLHLSAGGDIDFIDDRDEEVRQNPKKYPRRLSTSSRKISVPQIGTTLLPSDFKKTTDEENNEPLNDLIADVSHWNAPSSEQGYGIALSLYEKNPITNEHAGSPIADCYGLIARKNSCVMAMADGVNWGEKAKIASCSAVQASLEYLTRALLRPSEKGNVAKDSSEVFVSILRSFWEAQDFILEMNGHLTTLTVCVILPIDDDGENRNKYACMSVNLGDSLGYIYNKTHGVREFTQGSHDILNNRDMRDALGALGPVDGNKPELSNLTLSMTIVEKGDIVFLTSDGVSDNFDPVVGKFAESEPDVTSTTTMDPPKIELAPKRQNKSAPSLHSKRNPSSSASSKLSSVSFNTSDIPVRPPRSKKTNISAASISNPMPMSEQLPIRPKYTRSKTHIEPRSVSRSSPQSQIRKSAAGLPIVSAYQRHALTLLRMSDLFLYGINGTLRPCTSAKKLCNLLIDFTKMITSAKRKILEQRELFWKLSYDSTTGLKKEVEMNRLQQRSARKRMVDSHFSMLPGKLDHASVVAWSVGVEDGNNNNVHLDAKAKTLSLSNNASNIYNETDF